MYAPDEEVSVPSASDSKKYEEGKGSSCAAPAFGGIVALLKQCGRECGVNVNHILVKKIFSKMTINLDGENILCPKDFFLEYGTKDKCKNELMSSNLVCSNLPVYDCLLLNDNAMYEHCNNTI